MRIFICAILISAFLATAQKLETQTLDPKKVVRVETAKDHLTVIELGEPVTMVAIGNQNAFSIERRENKVFVKPIEEDAETNLFIWTTAGRFAYELVPASGIEQMHFAIDQRPIPQVVKAQPKSELPPKPAPIPVEMLTKARPILLQGDRQRTAG
jgi:type IV secretory pathway VirB9-like protein